MPVERLVVALVTIILKAVVARAFAPAARADRASMRLDLVPAIMCFFDKASSARCAVKKHDFFAARFVVAAIEETPGNTNVRRVQLKTATGALV